MNQTEMFFITPPPAQCQGVPHTCELTMPVKPLTPEIDRWKAGHGYEKVDFLDWVLNENQQDGFHSWDKIRETVAEYLDVSLEAYEEEQQALWEVVGEAGEYAKIHGLLSLQGTLMRESCPVCDRSWLTPARQVDGDVFDVENEVCLNCGTQFDLLKNIAKG